MYKRFLLAFLFLAQILAAPAQKVEVNKNGFYLNHHKIIKQTSMVVVDSLLGKPDRVSTLANIIWTYDKLGIFVYFSPSDSSLKQVNFQLVKRDLSFSPAGVFKGSLVMFDNRITTAWPLARLKRVKSLKFAVGEGYMQRAYASYLKIFFEFDEADAVLRGAGISFIL